ncbi:hypothetical protein B5807_12028 [Epicoccum nigrum]|uniref:Uncharacterized protein n=1 Tax=Epicoccum nigrum TaxID=105696 RepID=A0A1Y2LKB0_EPING|nr:hypothetical protein B5807_12028 [Epicoccum nigrum]
MRTLALCLEWRNLGEPVYAPWTHRHNTTLLFRLSCRRSSINPHLPLLPSARLRNPALDTQIPPFLLPFVISISLGPNAHKRDPLRDLTFDHGLLPLDKARDEVVHGAADAELLALSDDPAVEVVDLGVAAGAGIGEHAACVVLGLGGDGDDERLQAARVEARGRVGGVLQVWEGAEDEADLGEQQAHGAREVVVVEEGAVARVQQDRERVDDAVDGELLQLQLQQVRRREGRRRQRGHPQQRPQEVALVRGPGHAGRLRGLDVVLLGASGRRTVLGGLLVLSGLLVLVLVLVGQQLVAGRIGGLGVAVALVGEQAEGNGAEAGVHGGEGVQGVGCRVHAVRVDAQHVVWARGRVREDVAGDLVGDAHAVLQEEDDAVFVQAVLDGRQALHDLVRLAAHDQRADGRRRFALQRSRSLLAASASISVCHLLAVEAHARHSQLGIVPVTRLCVALGDQRQALR